MCSKQYQEEILFLRTEYETIFAENVSLRERARNAEMRTQELDTQLHGTVRQQQVHQIDSALDELSDRVSVLSEQLRAARETHQQEMEYLRGLLAAEAMSANEVITLTKALEKRVDDKGSLS